MPRDAAEQLLEFLHQQVGEHLRGAMHYTPDDYDILYLRDDVAELYSDSKLDELRSYYRQKQARQGGEPFSLGNRHCTVEFYDDAILFHFTQGVEVGTVITLDPEAGRNIVSFITRCLRQLHVNSPQTIEHVPTWLRDP